MMLKFALLVSGQREAEAFHQHDSMLGRGNGRPRYRFSVVQNQESYHFAIQRVGYPYAQEGKGWGDPVCGEKYHEQDFAFDELRSHLTDYGINHDCWEPVESEQSA